MIIFESLVRELFKVPRCQILGSVKVCTCCFKREALNYSTTAAAAPLAEESKDSEERSTRTIQRCLILSFFGRAQEEPRWRCLSFLPPTLSLSRVTSISQFGVNNTFTDGERSLSLEKKTAQGFFFFFLLLLYIYSSSLQLPWLRSTPPFLYNSQRGSNLILKCAGSSGLNFGNFFYTTYKQSIQLGLLYNLLSKIKKILYAVVY